MSDNDSSNPGNDAEMYDPEGSNAEDGSESGNDDPRSCTPPPRDHISDHEDHKGELITQSENEDRDVSDNKQSNSIEEENVNEENMDDEQEEEAQSEDEEELSSSPKRPTRRGTKRRKGKGKGKKGKTPERKGKDSTPKSEKKSTSKRGKQREEEEEEVENVAEDGDKKKTQRTSRREKAEETPEETVTTRRSSRGGAQKKHSSVVEVSNDVEPVKAVSKKKLQSKITAVSPVRSSEHEDDSMPATKNGRRTSSASEDSSREPRQRESSEDELINTSSKKNRERKLSDGKTSDSERRIRRSTESPDKTSEKGEKKKHSKTFSPKELAELEKYWKAVRANPQDFTGWTYLLQFIEQDTEMTLAREAFDAFFERYPYCYGYWKKYADLEKKNGDIGKCEEVFERGTKAVPLSVDFWIHFLNFYKTEHKDEEEAVRQLFERSIVAAGTEFRSDRLWDLYINWESDLKNFQRVTDLYDRLLSIPTQLYSHHFEMFQKHVQRHLPRAILSTDEFLAIRQEIVKAKDPTDVEAVGDDSPPPGMEDEDAPPGEDDAVKESAKLKLDAEDVEIREKIIEKRQVIHKDNEEEVSKRWTFEEGIKRPYFHVKPLERAQLKNWREYLDFEMENGSPERVVVLFERCMIACALYEEFWLKYAKYLEAHTEEGARNVYKRVCTIHLPTKVPVHTAWATYEEKLGNFDAASEILEQLEKNVTDFLPIMFHRINLERRRGKNDAAAELFQGYIKSHAKSPLGAHFAIKYARFCWKSLGDYEKAVETLETLLEAQPMNGRLYMQLVDVYYQQSPIKEAEIVQVMDRAITSILDQENKLQFAQRKVEFLEEFGTDMQMLQDAEEEYAKILKALQQEKKKRPPQDENPGDDSRGGGHSQKRSRREGSSIGYEQSQNSRYQQGAAHQQSYPAGNTPPAYPPAHNTQPQQQGYNYPAQNNWQNYQAGYGYPQQTAQSWPGYNQNYYGHS